jgi:BirA family biotin operon repressor/biotin-[acetyl-CoA-carboxylase] ligase
MSGVERWTFQWVFLMKFTMHRFGSVTSTNDLAIRMAEEGAPEGTVIVAEAQTSGRGRRGRTWSSPAGGLYLSIILRPDLPPDRLWQIAFVASLAAAEAVTRVSGLPARIKWPNDVLLSGRKVAGILVEARKSPRRRETQRTVVVGIGVNVNIEDFPTELAERATSIALQLGRRLDMKAVEDAFLETFGARYKEHLREGFPPLLRAWKELDCTVGSEVSVHTGEGVVTGRAVEVDSHGDLVIERSDGDKERVSAGEVLFRDIA